MKKLLMVALLVAPATAGAASYEMKSYVTVGGKTQEVLAWCDAPQTLLALTKAVGPGPNADGPLHADLLRWNKNRAGLGRLIQQPVTLGAQDAGAGQLYTPFFAGLYAGRPGTELGTLHTSNVENVQDPAYRMTHVNEFKLGSSVYSCRYVPQAAFLGVTAKRTVIIWDNGKTATYATRNFDGTPGVYVTGGKPINFGSEAGWGYEFMTRDGFRYEVTAGDGMRPGPSPLRLSVFHRQKAGQTEHFAAYSISTPKK